MTRRGRPRLCRCRPIAEYVVVAEGREEHRQVPRPIHDERRPDAVEYGGVDAGLLSTVLGRFGSDAAMNAAHDTLCQP
jgi:hypothetical protein